METLYIVMPAYNEEANIERTVFDWYPVLQNAGLDSRLVVADSSSTDKTHEILLALKEKYPQLEILSATGRQHGSKVIALYRHAIASGADYIFQTDSDGQTSPEDFPVFWQMRREYDAILGNRVSRGDGKVRAFVERVVCLLLRLYFGISVPDANAPFRLMKTSVVNKYIGRMKEDYNLPNIMLTTFFAYYKERLAFRTISFKPRQGGVNSVNILKIFRIGWNAMKGFRAFRKNL